MMHVENLKRYIVLSAFVSSGGNIYGGLSGGGVVEGFQLPADSR